MSNLDGATYAAFTIELSVASTETIQVEWFTEDGTAKAGTDYEATTGLLTFQPGELSKQVQVLVFGRDPADTQEDRNFHMRVKPPINAILGTSLTDVVITILDNEGTAIAALIVPSGPKGGKGDTGLSAYEEAFLQDPSVGTLTEWLESLKGEGRLIELQNGATAIQWRYVGDIPWIDLVQLADLKGGKGDDGPAIQMQATSTQIQWRVTGTTVWNNLIAVADLKGTKGDTGASLTNRGAWAAKTFNPGDYTFSASSTSTNNSLWFLLDAVPYASTIMPKNDLAHWQELAAPAGVPGASVELQKSATAIQWRQVGTSTWIDLVLLSDLKGDKGDNGKSVELQKSATAIQWRNVGDASWIDLVLLSAITGADGKNIELQKTATYIQWRVVGDAAWKNLVSLAEITGPAGSSPTGALIANNLFSEMAGFSGSSKRIATDNINALSNQPIVMDSTITRLDADAITNRHQILTFAAPSVFEDHPSNTTTSDTGVIFNIRRSGNAGAALTQILINSAGIIYWRVGTGGPGNWLWRFAANTPLNAGWRVMFDTASPPTALQTGAMPYVPTALGSTNINTLGIAARGFYAQTTAGGATAANGYPTGAVAGLLEVMPGPYSGAIQRYTSLSGQTWSRGLSAAWNGTDGPWAAWQSVGTAAVLNSTVTDLNLLGSSSYGLYANTSAGTGTVANNYPVTGADGRGLVEVLPGGLSSVMQRFTSVSGRIFIRGLTGNWNGTDGPWASWVEIGGISRNATLPVNTSLTDPVAFLNSGSYILNGAYPDLPSPLTSVNALIVTFRRPGSNNGSINQYLYVTGDVYFRSGTPNTATDWTSVTWLTNNWQKVAILNPNGALPISKGGHGATTLPAAQTALGINPAFLDTTANLNTALLNAPFSWINTSTNTPVAASYGRGFTIASSATDVTQWAIINGTNAVYVRYLTGVTWSAWLPFYATSQEGKDAIRADIGATPAGVREFMEQYGITASFNNAATDLNAVLRGVFFTWNDTTLNIPVASSYGRGFCIASDPQNITQFAIINGTGAIWMRFATTVSGAISWGAWTALNTGGGALPYLQYSNPGGGTFAATSYSPIPFYTSVEANGITLANAGSPSGASITVAAAGLYQFELEVRINGGATGHMAVGSAFGLSLDTITVPTDLRAGFSVADTVGATTVARLVCTERLTASAVRRVYLWNSTAATTLIATAVIKVTRLGA